MLKSDILKNRVKQWANYFTGQLSVAEAHKHLPDIPLTELYILFKEVAREEGWEAMSYFKKPVRVDGPLPQLTPAQEEQKKQWLAALQLKEKKINAEIADVNDKLAEGRKAVKIAVEEMNDLLEKVNAWIEKTRRYHQEIAFGQSTSWQKSDDCRGFEIWLDSFENLNVLDEDFPDDFPEPTEECCAIESFQDIPEKNDTVQDSPNELEN